MTTLTTHPPAPRSVRLLTIADYVTLTADMPGGHVKWELDMGVLVSDRLLTEADLAAMPEEFPTGPVKWELERGRLIAMTPPGGPHGFDQSRIITLLVARGDAYGHGQTCGEAGLVLRRAPDLVKAPDAMFFRVSRLPAQLSDEGYFVTMPDLAVEIRSPNETLAELQRKADDFLAAGVVCVWVIDPIGRQVIESRSGIAPRVIGENDTLTLDDVIPGFALAVRDVLG